MPTPIPAHVTLGGPACPDGFQDVEQVEKEVAIDAAGVLTLTLGSTPSIPCGWQAADISDATVIRQVDRHSQWPADDVTPKPGAPGTEIWVFEARRAGTSTLSLDCTCLGEDGTGDELAGVLTVSVTVKPPRRTLELMHPNGNEAWIEGETYKMRWRSTGVDTINIAVAAGGKDLGHVAFDVDAETGEYEWTIPQGFISDFGASASDAMRIRIYDPDNAAVSDENDAPFTLSAPSR
mgnify:CR=1 FL=1